MSSEAIPTVASAPEGGSQPPAAATTSAPVHDSTHDHQVFVGGLNRNTTDDAVRGFFSAYGEVIKVDVRRLPNGQSRGFAFVTFKTTDPVQKLIGNTLELDGRTIEVKPAVRNVPGVQRHDPNFGKIFVGGLPEDVTEGGATPNPLPASFPGH